MKPSGLGWAGDIPAHWDVAKLCLLARLESGHTPSRQRPDYWIPEECTIPWFSLADVWQLRDGRADYLGETAERISPTGLAHSAARLLPAGTVVLSRTASVGFAGIMPEPMATTQDFANWIPGDRVLSHYVLYALRAMSDEFRRVTMGSTHQTIYMPDIRRLAMPVPPRKEQERIIGFLQARLPAIDELIAKKERLALLLQEKRQAVITQAVTKGLDPGVRMKESGIEWIGRVPEHWDIARVKYVARLESGHTPSRSVPEHWLDTNDIPWVSLNDTRALASSDYISDTTYKINQLGLQNSSARLLPARVVVFTRDATIGIAAITTRPMAVSQHIIAWVCGPLVVPEYLLRVFYAMATELDRYTFGATIKTIGMPDVRRLTMPIPPVPEQQQIVELVVSTCSQLDDVLARVRLQVSKLREYRQSLITAAVTGKIDVGRDECEIDDKLQALEASG